MTDREKRALREVRAALEWAVFQKLTDPDGDVHERVVLPRTVTRTDVADWLIFLDDIERGRTTC